MAGQVFVLLLLDHPFNMLVVVVAGLAMIVMEIELGTVQAVVVMVVATTPYFGLATFGN
jgi:ABC-type methionine transport system permease subunit